MQTFVANVTGILDAVWVLAMRKKMPLKQIIFKFVKSAIEWSSFQRHHQTDQIKCN